MRQPPEERIDSALKEMRSAVAAELLDRISQSPPAFFEVLVLDLLRALGCLGSTATISNLADIACVASWQVTISGNWS